MFLFSYFILVVLPFLFEGGAVRGSYHMVCAPLESLRPSSPSLRIVISCSRPGLLKLTAFSIPSPHRRAPLSSRHNPLPIQQISRRGTRDHGHILF
mmetsp:Transcript_22707/g.52056  ORF Transcript_22707/g.52056 Transcript_22707/m.52056 type:complete len:96 (+) Transcript_22707:366-653(+)